MRKAMLLLLAAAFMLAIIPVTSAATAKTVQANGAHQLMMPAGHHPLKVVSTSATISAVHGVVSQATRAITPLKKKPIQQVLQQAQKPGDPK